MKSLEEQCDHWWSKCIRLRDMFCRTPFCNERSVDARHIMNRRHRATRWDLKNGLGGCRRHHSEETKEKLIEIIGEKEYNRLNTKAMTSTKNDHCSLEATLDQLKTYYHNLEENGFE